MRVVAVFPKITIEEFAQTYPERLSGVGDAILSSIYSWIVNRRDLERQRSSFTEGSTEVFEETSVNKGVIQIEA